MKVAWFTPFMKKSAIGRYSKLAVEALSADIDVELFVYVESLKKADNLELHQTYVPIHLYDSLDIVQQLNDYDLCIYNMGDNGQYHSEIYDVFLKHPGVVIAHDICMHNFALGYYYSYKNDRETYRGLVEKKYGSDAAMIMKATEHQSLWDDLDLLKYSFSEDLYSNAFGIIVHSEYHQKYLEQFYHCPILKTPLLYGNEWKGIDSDRLFEGYDSEKINILTVGNVNVNKHIDAIIETIGENKDLHDKVAYTVIGSQTNTRYMNKLKDLVQKYHIEHAVHLLGYVEEDQLEYYYHYADIISNLRYPAWEGASASLVEQMLAGKAIIVTDTGMYSEMPDECVIKLSPERIVDQLTSILRDIVSDKKKADNISSNAKRYALQHFGKDVYKEKVSEFIDQVVFDVPMRETMDHLQSDLSCMKDTGIYDILSDELVSLFA